MKIDPSILTHPKFVRLKRAVGTEALEHLIRIWGHCENARRGEFWKGADATYVEIVAKWDGEEGVLFNALVSIGWIHVEDGAIRVHEWNQTNWRAVSAWTNGELGGRKPSRKPKVKDLGTEKRIRLPVSQPDGGEVATGSKQKSQSEMIGNEMNNSPLTPNGSADPSVPSDRGAGGSFFEVPSFIDVESFVASRQMPDMTGAPPMDSAWAHRHRMRWESSPEKTPRDWRAQLIRWWLADGRFAKKSGSVWEKTQSIEKLRKAIDEHPFNESGGAFVGHDYPESEPQKWLDGCNELAAMRKRLRELSQELA